VDLSLAGVGLVLAAPVVALSAAAVLVTSGPPAFFRQRRLGVGGRPFTMVKIRTMRPSGRGPLVTARDDDRVTTVGRWLRRTKLDELPELWNVVRGDMALVGPRPEVPEMVDLGDPLWREVLAVRPGITDPVTVGLRDEESLLANVPGDRARYYKDTLQPKKLRGYVEYLHNRSWRSDLLVLVETAVEVLIPKGVRAA
jgi:lipopolysaccharide/colanic/teichoic acid biosynthesis glycosyltransferase